MNFKQYINNNYDSTSIAVCILGRKIYGKVDGWSKQDILWVKNYHIAKN